jgi:hypothetical protein
MKLPLKKLFYTNIYTYVKIQIYSSKITRYVL